MSSISELQTYAQQKYNGLLPQYMMDNETHVVTMSVGIPNIGMHATASAATKKEAKELAAKKLLEMLRSTA